MTGSHKERFSAMFRAKTRSSSLIVSHTSRLLQMGSVTVVNLMGCAIAWVCCGTKKGLWIPTARSDDPTIEILKMRISYLFLVFWAGVLKKLTADQHRPTLHFLCKLIRYYGLQELQTSAGRISTEWPNAALCYSKESLPVVKHRCEEESYFVLNTHRALFQFHDKRQLLYDGRM